MVATYSFKLASKLAPWLLAPGDVAFVVLNTEGPPSLTEILLVAIFHNASVLQAEISILKFPLNASWVFADV